MKNSRLKYIENWSELAREAKWSASAMAKKCGVSVRTLHRHWLKQTGKNTKAWLAEQRQRNALELLSKGCSVKETSACLAYMQPNNFSRQFKKQTGICPSMTTLPSGSSQSARKP